MTLTWKILRSSGDPYADTGGNGRFVIRRRGEKYVLYLNSVDVVACDSLDDAKCDAELRAAEIIKTAQELDAWYAAMKTPEDTPKNEPDREAA